MVRPYKHPKTGVYWLRKAVPTALRAAVGKGEIKRSLATKSEAEARKRAPAVLVEIDAEIARATGAPSALSSKDIVGLVGVWYRAALLKYEEDPGDPIGWDAAIGQLQEIHGEDDQEAGRVDRIAEAVREDIDNLLAEQKLRISDDSRSELEDTLFGSKVRLFNTLRRRAEGNYRRDSALEEFPEWKGASAATGALSTTGASLNDLFDLWASSRMPAPREKTVYSWRKIVDGLASFLGHSDGSRIQPDDIDRWRLHLTETGNGARTLRNKLNVIATIYRVAVKKKRVPKNPMSEVELPRAPRKGGGTRRLSFSHEEAATMLEAARSQEGYRRWVPWLLAFTGARLEEVCQAEVGDVTSVDRVWLIDINDLGDEKDLKTDASVRRVPLHSAVIAEGFLDYVNSLKPDGRLFPDITPDRFGRPGGNASKVLGRWVRSLGIEGSRKAPNHSWRHRFKDECRRVGIEEAVHDALTGHVNGGEGRSYGSGGYDIQRLKREIERLPKWPPTAGTSVDDRKPDR